MEEAFDDDAGDSLKRLTAGKAVDTQKEANVRSAQYCCRGCGSVLAWDALALSCLCVDSYATIATANESNSLLGPAYI
jgi:hypothetical protein